MEKCNNSLNLNLMTLNLYGYDVDSFPVSGTENKTSGRTRDRIHKLVKLMEAEKIDIVGFQEMCYQWYDNICLHMPKKYMYAGEPCVLIGADCNIMYNSEKFSLIEWGHFFLSPGEEEVRGWDAGHRRRACWGVFKDKKSGVIFIYATTHLDHIGKVARVEGAKMICNKIKSKVAEMQERFSRENIPAFLVGDYNENRNLGAYNEVSKIMKDAYMECRGERPALEVSSSPGMKYIETIDDVTKNGHYIDHIFFRGNAEINTLKIVHTSTNLCEYGAYITDHNAVIVNATLAN